MNGRILGIMVLAHMPLQKYPLRFAVTKDAPILLERHRQLGLRWLVLELDQHILDRFTNKLCSGLEATKAFLQCLIQLPYKFDR
jgi:hypothetical protein